MFQNWFFFHQCGRSRLSFHFLSFFQACSISLLQPCHACRFKRHLRGRGKFSQNVPKIGPSHITLSLAHCEHKGQHNGVILHIIVKGLVRLMYREAIYHPDLSISKTFHVSLPLPHSHAFGSLLLKSKCRNHLRISSCQRTSKKQSTFFIISLSFRRFLFHFDNRRVSPSFQVSWLPCSHVFPLCWLQLPLPIVSPCVLVYLSGVLCVACWQFVLYCGQARHYRFP